MAVEEVSAPCVCRHPCAVYARRELFVVLGRSVDVCHSCTFYYTRAVVIHYAVALCCIDFHNTSSVGQYRSLAVFEVAGVGISHGLRAQVPSIGTVVDIVVRIMDIAATL